MYFDEDLILDIRLNVLYDSVDKFIIAEATRDHAGKEKKLNFDLNNFSKFKKKIEYLIIDDLPIKVTSKKNDWHENHLRDQFQRNSLSKGYKNYDDNDLIMISDIDEIPDPKKISSFKLEKKYACFLQKNFQSKLNLLNTSDGYWPGTKICKKKRIGPARAEDNRTLFYKKDISLLARNGFDFETSKRVMEMKKEEFIKIINLL